MCDVVIVKILIIHNSLGQTVGLFSTAREMFLHQFEEFGSRLTKRNGRYTNGHVVIHAF